MPFGGVFGLVQLSLLGFGAAGGSEPLAVRIEFDGPADCSDAGRFYARVRARTERVRKAGPGEGGLELRVRLLPPVGGKVHGELRIIDERGDASTRSVDGASCEEVAEALSLTAALALDPSAMLTAPPEATPETPATTKADAASNDASASTTTSATKVNHSATKTDSAEAPPAKPSDASSDLAADEGVGGARASASQPRRWGGELGANLVLARVASPHLNGGVAAFARITFGDAGRVRGSLGLVFAHSGNDLLSSNETLSLRLTSAMLHACPFRFGAALTLEPCALASAGLLAASSRGVSDPDTSWRSHLALGGLVRVGLPVAPRLRLELEAGAFAPLLYRKYVLGSPERLLGETPGVSAVGALGASFGF